MSFRQVITRLFFFYIIVLYPIAFNSTERMKSIVPKSLEYPDALHMISFNAWALPVWIPNAEQIKRYKAIPGKLLEQNADIICVQEAFARKFTGGLP